MKRIAIFCLLFGFLISIFPLNLRGNFQNANKSEFPQSRKLKRQQKKEAAKLEAAAAELRVREQKKNEIEVREHTVDKNKKVKKISTDQNLPETVKKRNIP